MAIKDDANEIVEDIKDMVGRVANRNQDPEGVIQRIIKDVSKASPPKQVGIGAGVGFCAGFVTMKIGKMAATTIGGSLLLLQIAHSKGYVNVDWNRMTEDSASVVDRVRDRVRLRGRSGFERFQRFAAKNAYLAGGFVGGFFIGIASS